MMNTNEINRLANILNGYYMGEVIPPRSAINGYYDREMWEVCNPCTMYAEGHSCVECEVEYKEKMGYMGEDILAAHVTFYVEGGQFCKSVEYWRAEDVAKFVCELKVA